MRKYLNKSLLYQGDSKITLFLSIAYFAAFFFNKIIVDSFFDSNIRLYLYNLNYNYLYYEKFNAEAVQLMFTTLELFYLGVYLIICYSIIVGIHKRKKWSLLLSGPFSKLDIRKREFILIIISFLVFLVSFIIAVVQNIYLNYEIISYISGFEKVFLIDLIRIISVAAITIGGLTLLDSFFSNIYYVLGSLIFTFLYLIAIIGNLDSLIYGFATSTRVFRLISDNIMFFLEGYYYQENYLGRIIAISAGLFIFGVILILISKSLTKHMFVENMNEGILLKFPKKAFNLMNITFPGLVLAPFLSTLINEFYFSYRLNVQMLFIIKILIIVVVSFISCYLLKMWDNNKKDIYY
ncbi:hypothetical protein [Streptococcus sp.]|uniref:hypothetical protein n=1 Tax=Streptococcus sp. TaxID=1306 RepID=UPI0018481A3F|nr:hypothetical protein [Streptococcus sp.]HHU66218.1 hypothetical protein [Streptococcus sp.]